MEMLHGETLHELITRQGRLSHHEAVKVLLEATGPLFAAHKAGIVHRDLKPSNLFLCVDDDGERFLTLLDFGLAKRTAPDVLVANAALASSALPGLFPPVVLEARGPDGVRPYVPSERWVDGSLYGDLPKLRLARLHNVNHFIVSQTNPHVVAFNGQRGKAGVTRRTSVS
jgi:serine/threonine protein kinase